MLYPSNIVLSVSSSFETVQEWHQNVCVQFHLAHTGQDHAHYKKRGLLRIFKKSLLVMRALDRSLTAIQIFLKKFLKSPFRFKRNFRLFIQESTEHFYKNFSSILFRHE